MSKPTKEVREISNRVRRQVRAVLDQRLTGSVATLAASVTEGVERVRLCLEDSVVGPSEFDRRFSDHYALLLCHVTTILFRDSAPDLASQVFYLNKVLHGVQCSPRATLPTRLLLWHSMGVVIGSGVSLGEYLVIGQGVTIGQNRGNWPVIEERVFIGANSLVLGGSRIGRGSSIGAGTTVIDRSIAPGSLVHRNDDGRLLVRESRGSGTHRYFRE
jgi:serine O-acetyltransferase